MLRENVRYNERTNPSWFLRLLSLSTVSSGLCPRPKISRDGRDRLSIYDTQNESREEKAVLHACICEQTALKWLNVLPRWNVFGNILIKCLVYHEVCVCKRISPKIFMLPLNLESFVQVQLTLSRAIRPRLTTLYYTQHLFRAEIDPSRYKGRASEKVVDSRCSLKLSHFNWRAFDRSYFLVFFSPPPPLFICLHLFVLFPRPDAMQRSKKAAGWTFLSEQPRELA